MQSPYENPVGQGLSMPAVAPAAKVPVDGPAPQAYFQGGVVPVGAAPQNYVGNQPIVSSPEGGSAQQVVQTTPTQPNAKQTEDFEEIDHEWIIKAKDIVENTKHDPYLESSELSKLKSRYLHHRHDKQLKSSEDHVR